MPRVAVPPIQSLMHLFFGHVTPPPPPWIHPSADRNFSPTLYRLLNDFLVAVRQKFGKPHHINVW